MSDKTFVDTNVLIYAHDVDAKAKHEAAKIVLHELWSERTGVLSMQVLQEFYVNVTRKIQHPISKESARLVVSSYAIWCVDTTAAEISVAFRIEDASRVGFWDALIVASALKSGASRILSEDLNPGQTIAGIRIENPFAATGDPLEANIEGGRIVLTPREKRPRKVNIAIDPITRLPVLSAGSDAPVLSSKEVEEILTTFP